MRAGDLRWRCGAGVLLTLVSFAALAEYKDSYTHGLQALEQGDYAQARKLLKRALDEHPEPAVRTRLYGQVWQPYLPQYYLGLAAFKQGDCDTALAQWTAAENSAVVAQLPQIAAAQRRDLAACRQTQLAGKGAEKPGPVPVSTDRRVAENPQTKNTLPVRKPPPARARPHAPAPVSAPPRALVAAFDAYLAGHYDRVDRLDPDAFTDARSRYQAYLVRAASRYTRARISGNAQLLSNARADARAAKALDARSTPDVTLFSPAFRAFYNSRG